MKLYIVGFGAGGHSGMTFAADAALRSSDVIVGYTLYAALLKEIYPEKEYLTTGMRGEKERVQLALQRAAQGQTVSLVCSGDSGVYGLAELTICLAEAYPPVEIEVVPGVTAALSGGALLGAPLTQDFAVISLSDLLTPWETIAKRLENAAKADFVIVLYNPSSKSRAEHLARACGILLQTRSPETVCGYARNVGRPGEESGLLSLGELRSFSADMFTTVFIGNSETMNIHGKMVTPRGY